MTLHPYLFAAVAVVAVGLAIYELFNRHPQNPHGGRPPRRPPSPPRRPPSPPRRPLSPPDPPDDQRQPRNPPSLRDNRRPPQNSLDSRDNRGPSSRSPTEPKSISPTKRKSSSEALASPRDSVDSPFSSSSSGTPRDRECHLRKRNVKPPKCDSAKENAVPDSETSSRNSEQPKDPDPLNLSMNTYHKNIDEKSYEKDVYENIMNDISYRSNLSSVKNISDEDSDSENNVPEKINNSESCNMDVSNQLPHSSGDSDQSARSLDASDPIEFLDPLGVNQPSHSSSFASNDLSLLDDELEKTYKENILDNLRNEKKSQAMDSVETNHPKKSEDAENNSHEMDINVENQNAVAREDSMRSEEAIGAVGGTSVIRDYDQNDSISINVSHGICSGCEVSKIDAVAVPCGHSYLCFDCASRILNIYNMCSICHDVIAKFEHLN